MATTTCRPRPAAAGSTNRARWRHGSRRSSPSASPPPRPGARRPAIRRPRIWVAETRHGIRDTKGAHRDGEQTGRVSRPRRNGNARRAAPVAADRRGPLDRPECRLRDQRRRRFDEPGGVVDARVETDVGRCAAESARAYASMAARPGRSVRTQTRELVGEIRSGSMPATNRSENCDDGYTAR